MSLDKIGVLKTVTSKLKHENFHLAKYSFKTLQADGIMGEHFQLLCSVKEQNAATSKDHAFFVKKKPPHVKDMGKELCDNVFRKEIATFRMFKTINLPTLNTATPKCFYTDDRHLVLEDLVVQGYKMQTADRVATDEELLVVLQSLAGIHAAGIACEELHTPKNRDQNPILLNKQFPEVFQEIYYNRNYKFCVYYHSALIKGLDTAVEVFNLPEVLRTGKRLKDEIQRFNDFIDPEIGLQPSTKYRNTMCHCDLWPPNIFIRYDEDGKPTHAKIIDFQIERYLPPAMDVLDYILLNTTRDYRQKNLLKLKHSYYDFFVNYLEEYGVNPLEIYTFQEFLDSFKEIEMFAIWSALHTIPIGYKSNLSTENTIDLKSMITEDRGPLFSDSKNDTYRMGRIRDCVLDMMKYFENN